MQGYIKLHRRIQSNWIWKKKRIFSQAEAWIDILMEVQHSEKVEKVSLGMAILDCHRGESLKSFETWGERWNWHKSKVRRFLTLLQSQNMIELKNEKITTRLKVLQYEEYQGERNTNETQVKHKRNASETQMKTDKNEKNVKNEKNINNIKIFESSKLQLIKIAKEKYPDKNCVKAFDDMLEWAKMNGKTYKDWSLAYLKWVREDRFNKYKIRGSVSVTKDPGEIKKQEAERKYMIYRTGFLNKRFGKDKWNIMTVMTNIELTEEIWQNFKSLYPKESEFINT